MTKLWGKNSKMKINITYREKKSGISMRVAKSGDINVSAPFGTPDSEISEFIEKHQDWIEKATARMAKGVKKDEEFFSQLPLSSPSKCDMASRKLKKIIDPLLHQYERKMSVKANGYSFTRATSRWGSCNIKSHHINFSIYLLLLPEWCIEHVIVHELAHIIVPNHSADFYKVMDKHFPRWKEAREETKRISRLDDKDDDV